MYTEFMNFFFCHIIIFPNFRLQEFNAALIVCCLSRDSIARAGRRENPSRFTFAADSQPQSDPEYAAAQIGVFTLAQEQKDNFAREYLQPKQKYRTLSNKWNACKRDCPKDTTLKNYAAAFVIGEEQFNRSFYTTIDDDI